MSGRPARAALLAFALAAVASAAPPIDRVVVTSPQSAVRIELLVADGRLLYQVARGRAAAIETSRAGILIDGVDLGEGVTLGAVENYRVSNRYPWRGVHAVASDNANGARVTVTHRASGMDETIVLPPSEIGEAAVFARRTGDRWFVAAMNGPDARTFKIDLRFLKRSAEALVVRDTLDDPAGMEVETRKVRAGETIEIPARAAGGFVVRLTDRPS